MADQESGPDKAEIVKPLNAQRWIPSISDTTIPSVFANRIFFEGNKGDVSLVFVHELQDEKGTVLRPVVRIALSHIGFVNIVSLILNYARNVQELYGGHVPSLFDVNQDEINRVLYDTDHADDSPSIARAKGEKDA
jgi:hypothetical protein